MEFAFNGVGKSSSQKAERFSLSNPHLYKMPGWKLGMTKFSLKYLFQITYYSADLASNYYRFNNYVDKRKTFRKKTLTSQLFVSLIGTNGLIYSKFRALCHSFQPINEHYLCFIVFCLLFLITVDTQCQLFHSITTASNNINSKQSSKSKPYPKVIKQFRCECLWHHS